MRLPESIESLVFKNLDFAFSERDRVLLDACFEFPMNQAVVLKGTYGSGKSTVLKLMATLLEPSAGEYWINDHLVSEMSFEELIPFRMKIGYGFDYGGLLNNKSLRENLTLPLEYHKVLGESEIRARVDGLMEQFDLQYVSSHRPSSVSGSQRKLACVLRALVTHPEMLLLDNPTHGLGEHAVKSLIQEIQLRRERGELRHVFVVSDDKKFVEQVVDKEVFIESLTLKTSKDNAVVFTGRSSA